MGRLLESRDSGFKPSGKSKCEGLNQHFRLPTLSIVEGSCLATLRFVKSGRIIFFECRFMMKGRIAVFALLWVWTHFPVMAQNLVPNGSFEDYRTCPQFLGDFDRLSDWVQPAPPNLNSADFYHVC